MPVRPDISPISFSSSWISLRVLAGMDSRVSLVRAS